MIWMTLLLIVPLAAAAPVGRIAPQRLLLVGGGPRPAQALERLNAWAGGSSSRLLIVTWASGHGEDAYRSVAADLSQAGAGAVLRAPDPEAGREAVLRELSRASGVFFTGGDQNKLMRAIEDLRLGPTLRELHKNGLPMGGTSAGTAIMSPVMIAGPHALSAGLGLLPGTIVDQHFLARDRRLRLIAAARRHAGLLGIGIDEGSALTVEDGRIAEAFGPSPVTLRRLRLERRPGLRQSAPGRLALRAEEGLVREPLIPGLLAT